MSSERIVLMGTPPFAVASLRALVEAGIDVAAVVTAPDRPAGRGQKPRMSAVKEFALEHPHLREHILQPEKLKDPSFHAQLDATGASLYVVVAFRMLPEAVWNRPAHGTINLHASLLPDYRGAAPINWAVINGETRTGVSTFFLEHAIDTGAVIRQEALAIADDENAGAVHDRLMMLGAPLIVRTVQDIFANHAPAIDQSQLRHGALHHAPKLTPANCRLDPHRTCKAVYDHVRGLDPFPGAWALWTEPDRSPQHFKVLRTRLHDDVRGVPGTITIEKDLLLLHCADGRLHLLDVQAEGKRRMDASAFVRGLRDRSGIRLM